MCIFANRMAANLFIIGLGSNLGDRCSHLANAKTLISNTLNTEIKSSSIFESASWGYEGQAYLNCVVVCACDDEVEEAFAKLRAAERDLGRTRNSTGYADRTIDIDLLAVGNRVLCSEELILPHPRLHLRNFVLEPLVEILPQWKHPLLGRTSLELLELCPDTQPAIPFLCDTTT